MQRFRVPKNRPNNVSSKVDESDSHSIAPIAGGDDPAGRFARLKEMARGWDRSEVVTDEPNYLHLITRSKLFRFPDDNEFLLEGDVIHVKCAARMGFSDFDANRNRAEALRAALGA